MKKSLYLLSTELQELENALLASTDEETGEVSVDLVAAVDKLQGTFEEKAISVATVYRELGIYAGNIDFEITRLQALKKRIEHEQDRVKKYLQKACERTGTVSVQGVYANISFRKSEQTIIDDETQIPEEYITVKTTYAPNKTKIKEALKRGDDVPGAHIESVNNIQIK